MEPALWNLAEHVGPTSLSPLRLARDVAGTGVVALVLVLVSNTVWLRDTLATQQGSVVLASLAIAAALAAAALFDIIHRLSGDGRASWSSAPFALYGLVGVPAMMLGSAFETGRACTGAARLAVHSVIAVMLLAVSWPAAKRTRTSSALLCCIGLIPVLGAIGFAIVHPHLAIAVSTFDPLRWLVAAIWLLSGILIGWRALQLGLIPACRIAIGVVVLAFAHAYRIGTEPAQSIAMPGLGFSLLRLLALLIVLHGALQFVWRSLNGIGAAEQGHHEQLRRAEIGFARLAERDHELRNGIAGLAGASNLLGTLPDEAEQARLRSAVKAELARLDALLQGPDSTTAVPPECDVDATLGNVVALRRSAGMDVRCEVEPGLRAAISTASLTQVLVNLLANCARHAPGSPVRIRARRRGSRILVRVSDLGPGIPPGSERLVFDRGSRATTSPGPGLGLHIARELLAANGGWIEIVPVKRGCVAEVELPSSATSDELTTPDEAGRGLPFAVLPAPTAAVSASTAAVSVSTAATQLGRPPRPSGEDRSNASHSAATR